MKTSNIILLSFLVIIFLVPLGIFVTLSNKVANKEFTVVKNPGVRLSKPVTGSLSHVKVVKLKTTKAGKLDCRVKQGNKGSFEYRVFKDLRDSLRFQQDADTLFIEYSGVVRKDNEFHPDHIGVTLNLPGWEQMEVDGAEVILDSAVTEQVREVLIMNGGKFTVDPGYRGRVQVEYR